MQASFDALKGLITVLDPELIPSDKCVMVLLDTLSTRSAEGKLPSFRYEKKSTRFFTVIWTKTASLKPSAAQKGPKASDC